MIPGFIQISAHNLAASNQKRHPWKELLEKHMKLLNLSEILSQSRKEHETIGRMLSINTFMNNQPIILYGAGGGFITFSVFILKKYPLIISGIVDRQFEKPGVFHGIPSYGLKVFPDAAIDPTTTTVIITVGETAYHAEIRDYLTRLGYENIVLATEIFEYHTHYTPSDVLFQGIDYFERHRTKIEDSYASFADKMSRQVFLGCLRTYIDQYPHTIPSRPLNQQYFPKDVTLARGYSHTINCGAYKGDTVKELLKVEGKIKCLACFEPDLSNFEELSTYLKENAESISDTIISFPCGVYNNETELFFASGNQFNSNLSEEGDVSVQCVSIDHALPRFQPTFISMDIEGAELEALRGAEKTILSSRPDLAICVYHSINHLWDILLFLKNLDLDYEFYLRNYSGFISETVLYAVSSN